MILEQIAADTRLRLIEEKKLVSPEEMKEKALSYNKTLVLQTTQSNDMDYKKAKLLHNRLTESLAEEMKKEGKIRKFGFSFHDDAEILDRILTEHPDVDFVQLQINYFDWNNKIIQSHLCYETAVRHGKPIIVMEPVKGGTLANLPKEAADLLRDFNPDASPAS